mgnify:CR=1 FL=1
MEQKKEEKASAWPWSVKNTGLWSVNIVSGKREDLGLDLKNDQKGLGLLNILEKIELK